MRTSDFHFPKSICTVQIINRSQSAPYDYCVGKFERGSIEQFYHNVDTVGAGDEFKTHIDVLELEETLAVVRVLEEGWGDTIDFTDVLLLLKIDGEWKCVAKAYNQNSNTIKK